jgi:hypothetical protein
LKKIVRKYDQNWENLLVVFSPIKPSIIWNSQFWNDLETSNYDPCISRIEKICSKKCPKFLHLYASIYGTLNHHRSNLVTFSVTFIVMSTNLHFKRTWLAKCKFKWYCFSETFPQWKTFSYIYINIFIYWKQNAVTIKNFLGIRQLHEKKIVNFKCNFWKMANR